MTRYMYRFEKNLIIQKRLELVDADHVLLEILFQTVGALTIKASDDRDSLIVSLINRSLSDKRISLTG